MRKVFVILTCFLFILAAIAGIVQKKNIYSRKKLQEINTINCPPPKITSYKNAIVFKRLAGIPIVQRKDVHTLSSAEVASLRKGIAAMKKLPANDPRRLSYQTSIHGTFNAPNKKLWNNCTYAHQTQFFLAWHRMYLYFFERILIKYSGDPNLRLPYWNPLSNQQLPSSFTNRYYPGTIKPNPLYDGTRNRTGYSTTEMSSYQMYYDNAFAFDDYCSFMEALEQGPHYSVHAQIGGSSGNMGDLKTAALDPCFFLHHANIDRLWEKWIKDGNGVRNNPTSGLFLTQKFYFFDENKQTISMTGSDIIKTAYFLGYKYDDLGNVTVPNNTVADCCPPTASRSELIRLPTTTYIRQDRVTVSLKNATDISLASLGTILKALKNNERVYVEFDNVTIAKLPGGVIEVYFVPERDLTGNPSYDSFAGLLDLFSAPAIHNGNTNQRPLRVEITKAVKNGNISLASLKNAGLIFLLKNNGVNSNTVPDITLNGITVVLEKRN